MSAITEKIQQHLESAKALDKAMSIHSGKLKSYSEKYSIIESLEFIPGDYVWVFSDQFTSTDRDGNSCILIDKVYIAGRAKFNADGTDNRLEMTPEDQLRTQQTHISSVAYGRRPSDGGYSYYNKEQNRWWYSTSASNYVTSECIANTKEELIAKWSERYIRMRDKFFADHYAAIEKNKQDKIAQAKRVLEEAGQL